MAELDPRGTDPALRRMVLIGHSQGGLLAKLAVVDSGTRFWDNVSETPFDALRVSDETRAILRRSLFVTPLPFVNRVVFVATPHRGSDVAGFLVERFRWLVAWALTLPPSLVRITGEVLVGSEDPLLRQQLRQGLPRSVDNMSPGNQAIKTLATLPIAPGVTAHSIIAVKGGGSLGEGGDGVVSYRSAHIDEAGSELVVRSGHSVQSHPEAIEEIRRILLAAPRDRRAGRRVVRTRAPSARRDPWRPGVIARAPGSSAWGAVALVVVGAGVWGTLALHYSDLSPAWLRDVLAGAFAVLALVALGAIGARWRRGHALAAFAAAFLGLLLYWRTIEPSHERDWAPEVARLPRATVAGDLVTLHDIRNFAYRTETDFTPGYYDRTLDLRRLDALDLVTSYWMGPAIAHVFLSFGFGDDHVAVSVEARKERGEGYSSVQGFFKRYELIYMVGDERDLIRVRTNYRRDPPEDVYLYRTRGPAENARRVFLDYVRAINELYERPRFYDTLTTNCTTTILFHTRVNPGHLPLSWKVLLSGHAAEYAYDNGRLDTSLPFEELRRRSRINAAAVPADRAPDFSRRIREGRRAWAPGGPRILGLARTVVSAAATLTPA